MERRYDIEMSVPLGVRRGELLLNVVGELLSGSLTLFSHTTAIDSGSCHGKKIAFSGLMQTLGYTMRYNAHGSMTKKHIELVFDTEKGSFEASGRSLADGKCISFGKEFADERK
ncbi:MAG: hypothetical protein HFE63_01575 [Clostridiales bacterium]|nr:hypothetical protein [Clostridiales bacterium]